MYNAGLYKLKDLSDEYGHLTPIESQIDVPFEIKRVYYITKVMPDVTRGFHSHRKLHQVLICLNGSIKIRLKNPLEEETIELDAPSVGLYIGPNVWREMFDFSPGSVLLVLASDHYDEADYVRNFDNYMDEAKKLY